jgi:hypothetical protein
MELITAVKYFTVKAALGVKILVNFFYSLQVPRTNKLECL